MAKLLPVGNTPLVPMLGYEDVFIKREECNPFGTFKDRENVPIILSALRTGVQRLALVTAGSKGYSMMRLAQGTGIQVSCVVDRQTDPSIVSHLRRAGARVHVEDLSYGLSSEDIVDLCRTHPRERIVDVTQGGKYANARIIRETRHVSPDSYLFPVGGGRLGEDLHQGLLKFGLHAQLWGVTVDSPLSIADKLRPGPSQYRENIKALLTGRHRLITLNEEDVRRGMELVPKGIAAEPSSAVVYAVLEKYRKKLGRTVVINTGMCLS